MSKESGRDEKGSRAIALPAELSSIKPEDIVVEAGDTVTLSPESRRFKHLFQEIRPRSIDEVRQILGPKTVDRKPGSTRCCTPELQARLIPPEDLEAEDSRARREARDLAYIAGREYARSPSNEHVAHWKPVLDRYLLLAGARIYVVRVGDIEVQDGGMLRIAAATSAVFANKIRIHGRGKIVCEASTTLKALSLEGIGLPILSTAVAVV